MSILGGNTGDGTSGNTAKWIGLIGFVVLIGGYLALVLTGHDGDALLAKGVTVGGFFGVGGLVLDNRRQLQQVLGSVNGKLDARMTKIVSDELDRRGVGIPGGGPGAPTQAGGA